MSWTVSSGSSVMATIVSLHAGKPAVFLAASSGAGAVAVTVYAVADGAQLDSFELSLSEDSATDLTKVGCLLRQL